MSEIIKLSDLPCHVDDRGRIQMVFERCNVRSISRIESFPGQFRARHQHIESHWCEVTEGQIEIYHATLDKNQKCINKPTKDLVNKGEIIYTSPHVFHEMVFNVYTTFICYADQPRSQNDYEAGLIRYPTISLKKIFDNWED